jgi:GTP pyrophosphokinase
MTGLGKCCKPAPPTRSSASSRAARASRSTGRAARTSRGCRTTSPERLITADWGAPRDEVFPVDIEVEAIDRQGLLRDISEVFSREKINVTGGQYAVEEHAGADVVHVEVASLAQLKKALQLVEEVKGVMQAGGDIDRKIPFF